MRISLCAQIPYLLRYKFHKRSFSPNEYRKESISNLSGLLTILNIKRDIEKKNKIS